MDSLQTRLGDWVSNLTNTESDGTRWYFSIYQRQLMTLSNCLHPSWRVVQISKPLKNSTVSDWEEPTLVEQSLLADGSKFIQSSEEEPSEKSDMANSSSVVIEIEESDLINDSTIAKEPTVVEQSVLADSSSFIQITDEEIEDDQLNSDVKYTEEDADKLTGEDEEEERELQEDIILDQ